LDRAIAAFLLAAVIFRWTPPLQRALHAWPTTFLLAAYVLVTVIVIWILLEYTHPSYFPYRWADHSGVPHTTYVPIKSDDFSFYKAKTVSNFGLWDWMCAAGGALVYLTAATLWKNLTKESPTPTSDKPVKTESS
jgi:hypothetical protein